LAQVPLPGVPLALVQGVWLARPSGWTLSASPRRDKVATLLWPFQYQTQVAPCPHLRYSSSSAHVLNLGMVMLYVGTPEEIVRISQLLRLSDGYRQGQPTPSSCTSTRLSTSPTGFPNTLDIGALPVEKSGHVENYFIYEEGLQQDMATQCDSLSNMPQPSSLTPAPRENDAHAFHAGTPCELPLEPACDCNDAVVQLHSDIHSTDVCTQTEFARSVSTNSACVQTDCIDLTFIDSNNQVSYDVPVKQELNLVTTAEKATLTESCPSDATSKIDDLRANAAGANLPNLLRTWKPIGAASSRTSAAPLDTLHGHRSAGRLDIGTTLRTGHSVRLLGRKGGSYHTSSGLISIKAFHRSGKIVVQDADSAPRLDRRRTPVFGALEDVNLQFSIVSS